MLWDITGTPKWRPRGDIMAWKHAIRISAIVGLCFTLTGCSDPEVEIKQYIFKNKLSESKALAFRVCVNNLSSSKPKFPVPEGNMVMKSVPLEICGCQIPTIMTVFKEKQYTGYIGFANYMARENKKKKPKFGKKVLNGEYTSADAGEDLEESLNACVKNYKEKHVEESAELFELVPLAPEVKKKDKKTADTHS
jgi:hypothetical protein